MSNLYDYYHRNIAATSVQRRLIDSKNFTYINFHRYILPYIKRYILHKKRVSVLDIGSGAGTIDFVLGKMGCRVLGIDISSLAVQVATTTAGSLKVDDLVKYKNIELSNLCKDLRFDVVICQEVIEHVEDDTGLIRRVYSHLKTGGILIVTAPSDTAPLFRLGLTKSFDKKVGHLRRYNKDEFLKKIRSLHFNIDGVYEAEGVIRNSLYVFSGFGWLIKGIKGFVSTIITVVDDYFGKLFGYSDIIVVARKV